MRQSPDLLPCPFDRGTCDPDCLELVVEPDTEVRPDVLHGYITCHDCGARGPEAWADEDNIRATAAFGWNDRSALSQPALPGQEWRYRRFDSQIWSDWGPESSYHPDFIAESRTARSVPLAPEVPDTGGLVERYNSLIETALSYAADEKPAHEKFLPSVFELQVGHLKDIGAEFAAELSRLKADAVKSRQYWQDKFAAQSKARQAAEAALTTATEDNKRLREALAECAADWRSPPIALGYALEHVSAEFTRRMQVALDALEGSKR